MKNNSLKMWIVSALFAAFIAIFAQLTLPLPLVPITGQTFAVGLAVTILGMRYGTLSIIIYILLGAIGVPVFSLMTGGIGIILGPTGGYIIGFLPSAYIMGFLLERYGFTKKNAFIINLIGMLITLLFGTIWLKYGSHLTWSAAITAGILPFLIVGVIKAFASGLAGIVVRNRLVNAKLLPAVTKKISA
ncbi:MAG: biotin transporter BioY [Kurthia sp.]|nr:biotin transporter BioY [Candidatus Kurthia equi]